MRGSMTGRHGWEVLRCSGSANFQKRHSRLARNCGFDYFFAPGLVPELHCQRQVLFFLCAFCDCSEVEGVCEDEEEARGNFEHGIIVSCGT